MADEPWIVPPPAPPIHGSDLFSGLDATIADFWQFAMSDMGMNNTRGYLAEFLVAKALGLHQVMRVGSASAMVTLQERKTQYGIIINLPKDYTAASVNATITIAFATLPTSLKRILTWD